MEGVVIRSKVFTDRKRSLGQGNIFAPVCHSVHREGSASVHAGIPPPWSRHPPGADHAGRYGQRAGGTHPTGMQSCLFLLLRDLSTSKLVSLTIQS